MIHHVKTFPYKYHELRRNKGSGKSMRIIVARRVDDDRLRFSTPGGDDRYSRKNSQDKGSECK